MNNVHIPFQKRNGEDKIWRENRYNEWNTSPNKNGKDQSGQNKKTSLYPKAIPETIYRSPKSDKNRQCHLLHKYELLCNHHVWIDHIAYAFYQLCLWDMRRSESAARRSCLIRLGAVIRPLRQSTTQDATCEKVDVAGTILLHFRVGDRRTRVMFGIVKYRAAPVLLGTSLIDKFINDNFPRMKKIVLFKALPVSVPMVHKTEINKREEQ